MGRQEELALLRGLLDRAQDGAGQVALIQGEAGIGKTRLLAELIGEAGRRRFSVRTAEATELEQNRPFGLSLDAFGARLSAPDPHLAALARLVIEHHPWAGPLETIPVEAHDIVERMVGLFESLCAEEALLLCLDNAHWADTSSLALVRRLLRLVPQYAALLVVTTRPAERPEVGALLAHVAGAGGAVIELGPLGTEPVRALAGEVLGGHPGPRLSAELDKAAGNPLLVVELSTTMAQRGLVTLTQDVQAEVEGAVVPAAIDVAVLHRLNLLPPATVDLLRVAAILGREIDLGELALATGQDRMALAQHLRQAARARLVEESGERLLFRHELVHDALYQDWPASVRKALHRELGLKLAASGAPTYRAAHHLALGAETGDVEAIDWLHRAALEVAPRTPAAGASLLERVVDLRPAGSDARDTARIDWAVALSWSGREAAAEQVAGQVVAQTASPELRGRAAWWLASSLLNRGQALQAGDVCRQALAADVGSDQARVLLRLTEAAAAAPLGPGGSAPKLMRELLGEARRLGDTNTRCRCLVGLQMAEANDGNLEVAAAFGAEAVADAETLGPAEMAAAPAHICYAWLLSELDQLDAAAEVLERLDRLSGSLPRSSLTFLIGSSKGRVAFLAGRWDDAVVELAPAQSWDYAGSGSWAEPWVFSACIAVHRGDLGQAESALQRVEQELAAGGTCWALDFYMLAKAFLLEAQGRGREVAEALRQAWQLAETVPVSTMKPNVGPHLARWSAAEGDSGTALAVAGSLAGMAGANASVPRLAAAARWAAAHAGEGAPALLEAVGLLRQTGRPLESGLACEDAAALLAADGQVGAARALLLEALGYYQGLAASRRTAAARARLRRLGVRTGPGLRPGRASEGWAALTEAEARVVALAAQHLTNQEIADRLCLSRRTVETHVAHSLAKLGYVSRRELAAAAARQGPLPR